MFINIKISTTSRDVTSLLKVAGGIEQYVTLIHKLSTAVFSKEKVTFFIGEILRKQFSLYFNEGNLFKKQQQQQQ